MKKLMMSVAMVAFVGLGASQLFAKGPTTQSLRECTFTEEGQCYHAYRGSSLNTCVVTWGQIHCFYDDGTQISVSTN